MPKQESWFRESAGGTAVEILKTYDRSYAREVVRKVDDEAILSSRWRLWQGCALPAAAHGTKSLAAALEIEKNHDPEDGPDPDAQDYEDFLWEELSEASLEDVRHRRLDF
jgi:hypothetical protein